VCLSLHVRTGADPDWLLAQGNGTGQNNADERGERARCQHGHKHLLRFLRELTVADSRAGPPQPSAVPALYGPAQGGRPAVPMDVPRLFPTVMAVNHVDSVR